MATTIGSFDLASLKNLRDNVTQYFWFESSSSSAWGSGAHVTLYPESQFTNPNHANYMKGQNIIMNTDGFSIRNGGLPMMVLDNDSLDFNMIDTVNGTYTNVATFGTSSIIGANDGSQSYMYLDYHSLQMIDKEGDVYFGVSDLRDSNGYYNATDRFIGDGISSTFSLSASDRVNTSSSLRVWIDGSSVSSYTFNNLLGQITFTTPPANNSEIVATYTTTSNHVKAYTLGTRIAGGDVGMYSYALGYQVTASGTLSHTEGSRTTASGGVSHAEGFRTTASGQFSHSQNEETIAAKKAQTSLGTYNKKDTSSTTTHPSGITSYGQYAVIVGNGTSDSARSNALTVDWSGNVNIASGAKYKINGTNLSASDVSAVALSDKYTRSSAGDLGWTNQTDGDAKVIAKSALAFWNGAYNGNGSNLSKCSTGNIIGSNGGTMTGQLLTSYKSSVAMGSYGSSQTTVGGLVGEVRYSSGCAGSVSIGTAYTANGVTIPTGWYNFMYMPHRSGGKNGSADGDNANYGNLFLFGMNNTNGRFVVRVSSSAIAEVVKLVTTADIATTTATPSITTSTGTLVDSSIARSGKLRTLFLHVKNSSAISAGSNIYAGTLSTTSDRPAVWANGIGYYGSAGIMFQLKNTGEITGRVIGAQVAANGEVYASLTYVVS